MSWQKSRSSRTVIGDVPELGDESSVPDPYTLVDEDAQVDRETKQVKAESEQEAHVLRKTLDVVTEDDAPPFPVTLWPDRTSPQDTAKADISSKSEPTSHKLAEAAEPCDIEQLEQRYIDLQTQAARLYCLWISDFPPDNRRMRLQEAIETARAHVELGRETIFSAEQRCEH